MSEEFDDEVGKWSVGMGRGQGYVWYGNYTCTEEDIENLKKAQGEHVGIDELSLPGLYHPDWNSEWYKDQDPEQRPGGLGSMPYENQWCGDGVRFTKEEIHYIAKDGTSTYGIPPNCGAYHRGTGEDAAICYEGPEPGSEAAEILGKTAYHWDETYQWYYAGPDAKAAWWE